MSNVISLTIHERNYVISPTYSFLPQLVQSSCVSLVYSYPANTHLISVRHTHTVQSKLSTKAAHHWYSPTLWISHCHNAHLDELRNLNLRSCRWSRHASLRSIGDTDSVCKSIDYQIQSSPIEFAENGSIHDYIHVKKERPSLEQGLLWAEQVAEGTWHPNVVCTTTISHAWTCTMKVLVPKKKQKLEFSISMTTFSYSNHDQEVRVFWLWRVLKFGQL